MNQETDNNLDTLCEKVFTNPPADPCTWSLYLDSDIANEIPETEHAMYIFEILVQILFGGIKILFGTTENGKISLGALTMDDFELLRSYFRMMEYDILLDIYDEDGEPDYPKFEPTDFSTVHLKFLKEFEDENTRYVDIHFDNYVPPERFVHLEANRNPNDYQFNGI